MVVEVQNVLVPSIQQETRVSRAAAAAFGLNRRGRRDGESAGTETSVGTFGTDGIFEKRNAEWDADLRRSVGRIRGLLVWTAAVGGYACGAHRAEERLAREMAIAMGCDAPGRDGLTHEVQRT